ncbi:ankyrin repeat domain-containing protein [Psychroflexus sp. ALD_RP9]|uniref:ankyrin repeat domain-containing protein n=1 Tax=Psychroflexus sp. ALD_RP9 TaxID=2777186 RepID=UPI001A900F5E|nr:ankyrin repeat domain-containing protein [Psychroflexus sp. ALD_RP9]QSS97871.1 ankyrin repeat domain-containing protein [Psychroflexus sp. ALD_RP9]
MKNIYLSLLLILGLSTSNAQSIFDAARNGDVNQIEALVKSNPESVNSTNAMGFGPLVLAVYNNQIKATKLLLEKGANIDAQDGSGNTALMGAVFKNHQNMVDLLLNKGTNPNIQNSQGQTALAFAVIFNRIDLVKLLLKNNADKSIADKTGKTPLQIARNQQNQALVNLLKD